MPAIVDFPTLVKEALADFGDVVTYQPERIHFAEYLTGLIVADRKNVSAINREFAVTTDQSCLNRWLTEVDWDVQALYHRRLGITNVDDIEGILVEQFVHIGKDPNTITKALKREIPYTPKGGDPLQYYLQFTEQEIYDAHRRVYEDLGVPELMEAINHWFESYGVVIQK